EGSGIFGAVSAGTGGPAATGDSGFMSRLILDWSLIAAIGTMLAWGMNFAFVKYVLGQIGIGPFMFLRFLILPLLGLALLVAVFRSRIRMSWPRRADLPRFVLCAFVGHVLHISA